MLQQLLNTPKHQNRQNYSYLPVSTSLEQQLKKQATQLLQSAVKASQKRNKKQQRKFHDFVPNQQMQNVQNDLIMLKLKGYMDKRNITGINTQLKRLPRKVQVGRMIQGDPFLAGKNKSSGKRIGRIDGKKRQMSLTDYYLQMDKKDEFSTRKFSQIQRVKQRKKKITKKSLKKQKQGHNKKTNK